MNNPRLAAARALLQVFRDGAYSNLATGRLFEDLDSRDRAFAAALFYGVLERAVTLDWAMGCYSKTPVGKMTPAVREILRCGFYQLLYMPAVPPSAAVNETVQLTRQLGEDRAAGFVNGVLRAFVRKNCDFPHPKDRLMAAAVEYGVPAPLIGQWRRDYGPDAATGFLEACTQKAPAFARVNTLRTSREALLRTLAAEGAEALPCPEDPDAIQLLGGGSPADIPAFGRGLFHMQDLSSQRCAAVLDPRPGMAVLDLCAAPGGKTFTLAQRMGDRGRVAARDLHPNRLRLVEEGSARLGLGSVRTAVGDAQVYDPDLGRFDRVLCDVVCSGYGVIRRKPEIRYKNPRGLDGIRVSQYNILCTALNYLDEGGLLVYSTCTLRPQENEQVVEAALEEHPAFVLDRPMETLIPGPDWRGDGFFIAVLRHRSAGGG